MGCFELLSLVVAGDRAALSEFLNHRRLFSHLDRCELLLPELLLVLKNEDASSRRWSREADLAYDRAVDKFSKLSTGSSKGVDCTRYYRAALGQRDIGIEL